MADNALAIQMPEASDEEDEYLEIEDPNGGEYETEPTEDGGLLITIGHEEDASPPEQGAFYDNLADGTIPEHILGRIATDLLQKIEEDKESRSDRDKQYEEGLRRTGLGKDAPGGAEFDGASKVVHPMMTEACIDFQSRIMKEVWPASGPVKPNIIGEATKQKVERAKRKSDYMNYQLTTQMKEARDTIEQMASQLPLGGSQFIRLWFDQRLRRPRIQFIPIDKVILPGSAASYAGSDRRTFSDTISLVELKRRMAIGMYRKIDAGPAPMQPEPTLAEAANQKIQGAKPDGLNVDGDRETYETMAVLEITPEMAGILKVEEEGEMYPYLVTMEVNSKKVLSIYRDWEEHDETREPIDHLFEFRFLPWRGAYAIGLPQAAGGLSGSATGALRALLDSAFVANTQGGYVLKGSGFGSQSVTPKVGELAQVESGLEANDIRKLVMPFKTTEPSGTLFELLGFLVDAGKGVVRTSLDDIQPEGQQNVPVGTQLSRVKEGLTVFSSIHARFHASFDRLLDGLHRLNRMYLPKTVKAEIKGSEVIIRRRDFEGSNDIKPASDPTVYSDLIRIGQVQAMQARASIVPNLYNQHELELYSLKLMDIPDPERFLVPTPTPHELNAINENLAMGLGRPVVAFPDQDHLAHLQAHFDFANSPVLGANPIIAPKYMPLFLPHVAEHILYFYVHQATQMVEWAAGTEAKNLFGKDADVKAELDRLFAKVSMMMVPKLPDNFAKAMPIIAKAMQVVQAMQPPRPMDPAAAAAQAAGAETQRKTQADQGNLALKSKQIDTQAQAQQQRNAIDAERVQAMKDNAALTAETAMARTELDNETARDIESSRLAAGQGGSRFKDAESLSASGG